VLDALQMALWLRGRAEHPVGPGLVHRGDARSSYPSLSFTAPLDGAGIDASIGIVGDLDHPVVVPLDGIGLLTGVRSSLPRWRDRPLTCQEEG
jgi:hypothetical protein